MTRETPSDRPSGPDGPDKAARRMPEGEASSPAPAARPVDEASSETVHHILLAEDDDRLRALTERALRRLGYEVTAAGDGEEALRRLDASPRQWDLVISDLVMPGMGGLDLYELTRQRGWSIPFLLTSGHGPDAVSDAGGPGPRPMFLEKPWTLQTLRLRVRSAIDGDRASA